MQTVDRRKWFAKRIAHILEELFFQRKSRKQLLDIYMVKSMLIYQNYRINLPYRWQRPKYRAFLEDSFRDIVLKE
jgi:hypothetical protein